MNAPSPRLTPAQASAKQRELDNIDNLIARAVAYRAAAERDDIQEGVAFAGLLNAIYDLTELDEVYDRYSEVRSAAEPEEDIWTGRIPTMLGDPEAIIRETFADHASPEARRGRSFLSALDGLVVE